MQLSSFHAAVVRKGWKNLVTNTELWSYGHVSDNPVYGNATYCTMHLLHMSHVVKTP